jgi:hypothetical protein
MFLYERLPVMMKAQRSERSSKIADVTWILGSVLPAFSEVSINIPVTSWVRIIKPIKATGILKQEDQDALKRAA